MLTSTSGEGVSDGAGGRTTSGFGTGIGSFAIAPRSSLLDPTRGNAGAGSIVPSSASRPAPAVLNELDASGPKGANNLTHSVIPTTQSVAPRMTRSREQSQAAARGLWLDQAFCAPDPQGQGSALDRRFYLQTSVTILRYR